MRLPVPQDISFNCPEGIHPGTVYQAKPYLNGNKEMVRLLFTADDLTTETQIVLVGRNFAPSLHRTSDLRRFLDTWLGPNFVEDHTHASNFDFESLHNKKGIMAIQHNVNNKRFRKPFVHLQSMHPLNDNDNNYDTTRFQTAADSGTTRTGTRSNVDSLGGTGPTPQNKARRDHLPHPRYPDESKL